MTPKQINLTIAEALGWKRTTVLIDAGFIETVEKEVPGWISPSGQKYVGDYQLPTYANSLDAMHAVEKTLTTDGLAARYFQALRDTFPAPGDEISIENFYIHATSLQRAEAFLRAKGLWKDACLPSDSGV